MSLTPQRRRRTGGAPYLTGPGGVGVHPPTTGEETPQRSPRHQRRKSSITIDLEAPPVPLRTPVELAADLVAQRGCDQLFAAHEMNTHFLCCSTLEDARKISRRVWSEDIANAIMDPVIRGEDFAYLFLRVLENLATDGDAARSMNEMDFIPILLSLVRTNEHELVYGAISLLVALTHTDTDGIKVLGSCRSALYLIDLLKPAAGHMDVKTTDCRYFILQLLSKMLTARSFRQRLVKHAYKDKLHEYLQELVMDEETPVAEKAAVRRLWKEMQMWDKVDELAARGALSTAREPKPFTVGDGKPKFRVQKLGQAKRDYNKSYV